MTRSDYVREWHYQARHHDRFKARVEREGLTCQDCRGAGGYEETISWELGGPWMTCGWCEGTGKVTRWLRGFWLKCKRDDKRVAA